MTISTQQAIETLERFQNPEPWEPKITDRAYEALQMAISALEKREKKPAKAKFNKRYNKFVYFCPVCGEVTGNYDFCSECGQAIDYDNTEPYTEEENDKP